MSDNHINPDQYKDINGKEAIDIVREELTPEEFLGFLKGSKRKYSLRGGRKKHISQDMLEQFINKLPEHNTPIMRTEVLNIFASWKAEINNQMHDIDASKEACFDDKLKGEVPRSIS